MTLWLDGGCYSWVINTLPEVALVIPPTNRSLTSCHPFHQASLTTCCSYYSLQLSSLVHRRPSPTIMRKENVSLKRPWPVVNPGVGLGPGLTYTFFDWHAILYPIWLPLPHWFGWGSNLRAIFLFSLSFFKHCCHAGKQVRPASIGYLKAYLQVIEWMHK